MEEKKKTLLIVGNDKLGRKFIKSLPEKNLYTIVLYESRNIGRVLRLIFKRKSLSLIAFMYMAFAELFRDDYKIKRYRVVSNNSDIHNIIINENISEVFLFRVGIIINKKLISSQVDFYNVHCAKIPEFGGIGQIYRIYRQKAFDQVATLHQVIGKIDEGQVLSTKPYQLNSSMNYMECENTAYNTGIELLIEYLQR